MSWYRTGTVAVTNGSNVVLGTGTLWSLNAHPGDAFTLDEVNFYEVAALDATTPDTKLTLVGNFNGSTTSGAAYATIPLSTVSLTTVNLANQVSALLNGWQAQETQLTNWQGGSATGGFNISGAPATGSTAGYYPLTNALGVTTYVACPAKLAILMAPLNSPVLVTPTVAASPAVTDNSLDIAPTIWVRNTLRQQLEASTGGQCTVLYDSAGNANMMRIIPAFNGYDISPNLGSAGVPHPAFFANGVFQPEIFIAMYPAVNIGGLGCSLPNQAPYVNITWDNAKAACVNKGTGWHMMTNWEWAALTLWCIKNGNPIPDGNTNYGQSYLHPFQTGIRCDSGTPGNTAGAWPAINGGSGPANWRHDGTMFGISDLVGNIWEWQDGFKLEAGVITMPTDNYFTQAEASWPTHGAIDGTGGVSVMSESVTNRSASLGNTWNGTTTNATTNALIQKQALLCPYDTAANMGNVAGYLWANNSVGFEGMPLRGGGWSYTGYCGLAALHLGNVRSNVNSFIGFRPAFIA